MNMIRLERLCFLQPKRCSKCMSCRYAKVHSAHCSGDGSDRCEKHESPTCAVLAMPKGPVLHPTDMVAISITVPAPPRMGNINVSP